MGKTITITEEEFQELAAQTAAEITIEHGEDKPGAVLLFSLASIAFASALARKLFPENGDDKETPTEPDVGQMRKELDDFCDGRLCADCPMGKGGFECGRGKTFIVPMDESGYMTDESIVRHYKAMKGAQP